METLYQAAMRACELEWGYPLSWIKVCDSLKGKVNEPGQWEGLYHADSNLVLIKYYDFDPNIKKKIVLSNAFVNSKKKPPAAAVAFCNKFTKGLFKRFWPHKQGGYLRLGDLAHQQWPI